MDWTKLSQHNYILKRDNICKKILIYTCSKGTIFVKLTINKEVLNKVTDNIAPWFQIAYLQ